LYFGDLYRGQAYSTEYFTTGWVVDDRVESLGHRRWILDPFLKYISYGRVDGNGVSAAALKVIHDESQDITKTNLNFVAYPYGDYPDRLFAKSWYLSFNAIVDRTSGWGNGQKNINYKKAKIEVRDPKGRKLGVSSIKTNYEGYGIPNIIQWKTRGLANNVEYTVTIKNVTVNGKPKDYTYKFRLLGRQKVQERKSQKEDPKENSKNKKKNKGKNKKKKGLKFFGVEID
ncbi:MAG: hypothetical protein ABUK01_14325, partial [Leptospirales bacterium]